MKKIVISTALATIITACVQRPDVGVTETDSNTRVSKAILTAMRSSFGGSDDVKLAYPRVEGIHAGDVFVAPRATDADYVSFRLQDLLCNLGRELGPDVAVENKFPAGKTALDEVFNFNATVSADIAKLFTIKLNKDDKPISAVRVKIANAEAWAVSETVKSQMYGEDSPCAKRVARAIERKQSIVMIDLVYKGSPYIRVAHNLSASAALKKEIGFFATAAAAVDSENISTHGDEKGTESFLLGASYRPIRSVSELRP